MRNCIVPGLMHGMLAHAETDYRAGKSSAGNLATNSQAGTKPMSSSLVWSPSNSSSQSAPGRKGQRHISRPDADQCRNRSQLTVPASSTSTKHLHATAFDQASHDTSQAVGASYYYARTFDAPFEQGSGQGLLAHLATHFPGPTTSPAPAPAPPMTTTLTTTRLQQQQQPQEQLQ